MTIPPAIRRPAGLLALSLAALPLTTTPAVAQEAPAPVAPVSPISLSGDLRAGYFGLERDERDGSTTTSKELRARLRLGAELRIAGAWSAKLRLAGRLSTGQESVGFFVRDHAPTPAGLRPGEATVDEAYLGYGPSDRLRLRAGRFQSKFALADLMGKSLDRSDSPNTDITWTDGVHLTVTPVPGWRAHLLAQHNAPAGPTNLVRAPLDLTDHASRVTWFAALESTAGRGALVQRALDVTYIPAALKVDGADAGATEDYLAVVARGAAAWPTPAGHLLIGGEAGYAPNRPSHSALELDGPAGKRVGGAAYQLALTLSDRSDRHRVGVVHGRADAGWLVAPDFRNNDRLTEARYQWRFARGRSFEVRMRHRRDLERPISAARKRDDVDGYFRVTWRF
jgi:hypothetical protein